MTIERTETTGRSAWTGFKGGLWRDTVDVRDFIQHNYTPTRATAPS
ncbi:hypothetical protein ACFQZC_37840 [Streptacidiphilus monticola]